VWFSDRRFGNVADNIGDDEARVGASRARLAGELRREAPWLPGDPASWVWLRQVHGSAVVTATDRVASGAEADAVVTAQRALPLAIVTADCVPLALASDDCIAAVHAGWRGLAHGVVERAVEVLREHGGGEIAAVLGPAIGPCHYAFGAAERAELVARFGDVVAGETAAGEPAVDLRALACVVLERTGVREVDDTLCACTFHFDRYFSHRREPDAGRQAMVVAITP